MVVATLWPNTSHIGKESRMTVPDRQQFTMRSPAAQFASHPAAMTNSEGEFSLLKLQ
jgi:hypothetical protein